MSTRRERERREQSRERAKEHWKQYRRATNRQFASPCDDLQATTSIAIWSRVSMPKQKENGDLEDETNFLKYAAAKAGARVKLVVKHVGSGKATHSHLAALFALCRKNGWTLFVESVDRLVRPDTYTKVTQGAQLSQDEIKQIKKLAEGVPIICAIDPDASSSKVRQHQIKRGLKGKKLREGVVKVEGYRKQHKVKWLPEAIRLRKQGRNIRDIATVISYESGIPITHSGICKWLDTVTV